jgi:hypothetical protein
MLKLKVTDHIIALDTEEKMLLKGVIQQYLNIISLRAAVNLIEAAVNCTAAFNIHFAAIFEHLQLASISICFHGNIARSTVREFLLYFLPQVQPILALQSPC